MQTQSHLYREINDRISQSKLPLALRESALLALSEGQIIDVGRCLQRLELQKKRSRIEGAKRFLKLIG
jgi:hypothetical protein